MKDADGTLTWRANFPPIQYCTHSLGPLLFITDDRCVSATGLSSGSNVAPDIGAIDLEVGLFRTANETTISCPVDIPPSIPPELFDLNFIFFPV
mgnify:CR=1 FL=1